MSKPYCDDIECSRKNSCKRFFPDAPPVILGDFKEWRGCECNFFIPNDDSDITAQEKRYETREQENDARKDLLSN